MNAPSMKMTVRAKFGPTSLLSSTGSEFTDVNDMLQGENARAYAISWLGNVPNREDLAKRVSPLTDVRPGLPPILTIHGDADHTVPYSLTRSSAR